MGHFDVHSSLFDMFLTSPSDPDCLSLGVSFPTFCSSSFVLEFRLQRPCAKWGCQSAMNSCAADAWCCFITLIIKEAVQRNYTVSSSKRHLWQKRESSFSITMVLFSLTAFLCSGWYFKAHSSRAELFLCLLLTQSPFRHIFMLPFYHYHKSC